MKSFEKDFKRGGKELSKCGPCRESCESRQKNVYNYKKFIATDL